MTVADPSAPGGSGRYGDPKFADQEPVLREVLASLALPDPFAVLDLGCGTGRMYDLVRDALPGRRFSYDGVDRDGSRLEAFRGRLEPSRDAWVALFQWDAEAFLDWAKEGRWDLVLAVELLMHLPPVEAASLASAATRRAYRYLVTCDWDAPSPRVVAPGNYLHDYDSVLAGHARYPAGAYQSVRVVARGGST